MWEINWRPSGQPILRVILAYLVLFGLVLPFLAGLRTLLVNWPDDGAADLEGASSSRAIETSSPR